MNLPREATKFTRVAKRKELVLQVFPPAALSLESEERDPRSCSHAAPRLTREGFSHWLRRESG